MAALEPRPTVQGIGVERDELTPTFHVGAAPQAQAGFDVSWLAAGADGLLQALPAAIAFNHVDPDVLKAIQFSTADHVHGLRSVENYIHEHFFSQSDLSADGWLHRLEGYVAEQKAAAALEHAGHHIEFPDTPNHPDVDFFVDGHPWQIKEGTSAAAHVKEFLLHHHDGIEIGTSPDVAAALHGPHVHGITGLDYDTISSVTEKTLDGVKEGFDVGFHFPVITFGVSTYRELALLRDEKTTIERAAKNVGVDVASVGAGAWAGAKAGAMAMAAFPPGAAFGALAGSVVGAFVGKWGAAKMRYSTFNRAKDIYLKSIETAKDTIAQRVNHARNDIEQLTDYVQRQYEEECSVIIAHVQSEVRLLQESCQNSLQDLINAFPAYLEALLVQLRREQTEIVSLIPMSFWAIVFPQETAVLRSLVKDWFVRAAEIVASERERYLALQDRRIHPLLEEIRRFLTVYEFELQVLESEITGVVHTFDQSKAHAERLNQKAVSDAKALRNRLLQEFSTQIAVIGSKIDELSSQWKRDINNNLQVLRNEARPLGIEI